MLTSPASSALDREVRHLLGDALDDDDTIADDDTFASLGLNSLMLARLVIALELELGVDPFAHDVSIVEMHCLGDLRRAYESAAARAEEGRG